MAALRIAYLVNQYPAVSHTFIRREIQALERAGHQVDRIAVRPWSGQLVDAEDVAEQARTRYLLAGGLLPLLGSLLRALAIWPAGVARALAQARRMARLSGRPAWIHLVYVAQACRLSMWLSQGGISHVHAHFGTNSAEVAMQAFLVSGLRYSFTAHGYDEFDAPQALGLAHKIRHARFVVAISSFGRSQLLRWIPPEQWSKIQVVHCGLEPGYGGQHKLAPIPGRLVCVGRLCGAKGHLIALEAAAVLAREGFNFELVLAGDGELRGEVERRIAELDLPGRVSITGWLSGPAVQEQILQAHALVQPSFAEGLPVVVMEAMALGRPVIASAVAGVPELVQDGRTGWLVPAGSAADLAAAMRACLLASPEALARMGEDGRARTRRRHDIDRSAARLADLFAREIRPAPMPSAVDQPAEARLA
jgi:glycosyltransferase involved in cell wall biosynthesis